MLTPEAQPAVTFRACDFYLHRAIINRYGFNSAGADVVSHNLTDFKSKAALDAKVKPGEGPTQQCGGCFIQCWEWISCEDEVPCFGYSVCWSVCKLKLSSRFV